MSTFDAECHKPNAVRKTSSFVFPWRKDLRSLLIKAAQAILRSKHPLAKWGQKLLRRKGAVNLVAAAIARKLIVVVVSPDGPLDSLGRH